ncbi:MAG: PhzF family phenazine biosynthesis protein [Pseudomonadota bacterium]|nr:MAG: PhzF family phenazine biosynthesis protein [Pseudomonadota bacterium]
MSLRLYQVDAFADRVFGGNPAAVVPLDHWPAGALLQAIAGENNLSETAFFVPRENRFELRWFTPVAEVDLCGHATLASAHVLFEHLGYGHSEILFDTRSGELRVARCRSGLRMNFPAIESVPVEAPPGLIDGLLGSSRTEPVELLVASDYLVVLASEGELRSLAPDFVRLAKLDRRGVLATAPGETVDFVSRCFFPALGVNEDPVTGSAHCELAPYWARRLGRQALSASQLSRRGGCIECRVDGDRVWLTGRAVDYMVGEISVDVR